MISVFNRATLTEAMRDAGVRPGDVVFSHSNIGFFGPPQEGRTPEIVFRTILGAMQDAIGPDGTLVVPTFTWSFCKGQPFDWRNTPSMCGAFTEMLRRLPSAYRSRDPIFSVAALGARADELTVNVPEECFGPDSFWDRFLRADGIICNLNLDAGSTFLHFVERLLGVSYRYAKPFAGEFVTAEGRVPGVAVFHCQDLSNPDTSAAFEPFDQLARNRGLARSVRVGRGAVVAIRAADTVRLLREELPRRPWLLTLGGREGRTPELHRRIDPARCLPDLARLTPAEFVDALLDVPLHACGDGMADVFAGLSGFPGWTVHSFLTGSCAGGQIMPEKWTCHEAHLTPIGIEEPREEDVRSHVVPYSRSFFGEISREELLAHLRGHPDEQSGSRHEFLDRPGWALSLPGEQRTRLNAAAYRVHIRTERAFGTVHVGESATASTTGPELILAARLAGPGMPEHGLTGAAVGLEVMRQLHASPRLRCRYRLLLVPEEVGLRAWLAAFPPSASPPPILWLEHLGGAGPLALHHSLQHDSPADHFLAHAFSRVAPGGIIGSFHASVEPPALIIRRQAGGDEASYLAGGLADSVLLVRRLIAAWEARAAVLVEKAA
jgi:aminoglycoside 3-N-acetyltransferase